MLMGNLYLLLYSLGLLFIKAHALRNNSFDDTNREAITYSSTGQWVGGEGGKGLGTHTSSREWFAYAYFNFTGFAVYYWAPLFGDTTIIDFSLDGGPSTSISLTDPDVPKGGWVITKESAVRASFTNLENRPHTLKISMDGARSTGIIVDYFEVTVDDDAPSQTVSTGGSSNSPSSTFSPPSKSAQTSNSANNGFTTQDAVWQSKYNSLEKSYNNIKTALAVVGALFGVFICCTLIVALGGIRLLVKRKDAEKEDKAKTGPEVKGDSPSSSKDLEKSSSPQSGPQSGPQSDATPKSILSNSDGADVSIPILDGSRAV